MSLFPAALGSPAQPDPSQPLGLARPLCPQPWATVPKCQPLEAFSQQ